MHSKIGNPFLAKDNINAITQEHSKKLLLAVDPCDIENAIFSEF